MRSRRGFIGGSEINFNATEINLFRSEIGLILWGLQKIQLGFIN